jgi:alanine-synthesizing transaminase
MYAFVGANTDKLPGFDDQAFAMELLETQHVLVAPGSSFNVDYRNYFRITILPEAQVIDDVFERMEQVLQGQ